MPRRPTRTFNDPNVMQPGTPRPLNAPEFDAPIFDELIRNRGLRWIHEKAALCPNIRDLESNAHDPNCRKCENGYLYFGREEIMGIFQSNKLEKLYEIQGVWDVGEAVVTFTSYLPGEDGTTSTGKMVDFMHQDKLMCLDYTFTWSEIIEHSPSGVDRLRYPAVGIEFASDTNQRYTVDVDFVIDANGWIKWTGKNRPQFNQSTNRGGYYTVVYTANPVFYVIQVLHEIRATKGLDRQSGQITAIRLPQQLLIRRDYLFSHPSDTVGGKQTQMPRKGTQPPT